MSSHSESHKDFNLETVLKLCQDCKTDDGAISIESYCDVYEEVCKFFKTFGAIFGFITADIMDKIGILRDYQKSENGENFKTVQSMVKYEMDNDLTDQGDIESGCRTLLRLHRAFEFFSAFLTKIKDTDNSCNFSKEATNVFDSTAAKFHHWLVIKTVHMAMYVLPDRVSMLEKMRVADNDEGMAILTRLTEQLNVVYDIIQELYSTHNLLDLP